MLLSSLTLPITKHAAIVKKRKWKAVIIEWTCHHAQKFFFFFFFPNKVLEGGGATRPRENHPGRVVILGQWQDRPQTERGREFLPGHREEELPRGTCLSAGGPFPRRP